MNYCEELQRIDDALSILSGLDVACLSGTDAASLLSAVVAVERKMAALRMALGRRAVDGNVHLVTGARDGASWLASATGTSVGAARQCLETSEALADLPEVATALRSGEISAEQATHVASAAVVDPSRQGDLVKMAKSKSLLGLKRSCAEAVKSSSAEQEAKRWESLKAKRYFRSWTNEDGMVGGSFLLMADDGARLLSKLKPYVDRAFKRARSEGRWETSDNYGADGLVDFVGNAGSGRAGTEPARRAKTEVVVLVDYQALVRGYAKDDERCEIEGVGPIPVALAKSLAEDCYLSAIVMNQGKPVMITGKGHYIPNRLRIAVLARDRCCVVPGCDSSYHLELDHIVPVASNGATTADNLRSLCKTHHDMRTYRGFDLVTGDDGEQRWLQVKPATGNRWAKPKPKAGAK